MKTDFLNFLNTNKNIYCLDCVKVLILEPKNQDFMERLVRELTN